MTAGARTAKRGVRTAQRPLPVLGVLGVLAALLVTYVAYSLSGGALPSPPRLYSAALTNTVTVTAALLLYVRSRQGGRDAGAWRALAAAIGLYATGDLYWDLRLYAPEDPPIPSLSDAFWLAFYLPAFAAIVLLIRGDEATPGLRPLIDAMIATFALAAIASATVLSGLLTTSGGSVAEATTNLAYPIGDIVLLMALGTAVIALGKSADRTFWLLAAGLSAFLLADITFLLLSAADRYGADHVVNAGWPLGALLMAAAAWEPRATTTLREPQPDHRADQSTLAAYAAMALVVLTASVWQPVNAVAELLAIASMALIVVRLALEARESREIERDRDLQARTDDLTGLPNRRAFSVRLDEQLKSLAAEHAHSALLLMDLDHFKEINDSLGHAAGDLLLQEASMRLRRVAPDSSLVARLGGDEFVVLVGPGTDRDETVRVAEKIQTAFAVPTQISGVLCHISASIGIALIPEHGSDRSTLLRRADIAMYAAKRSGTGICLFDPDHEHVSRADVELVGELRRAIPRGELELHYHPIADVQTGRVHTVEALVRWHHRQQGMLRPDQFLPLAERHGLLPTITDRLLEEAFHQQRLWASIGLDLAVTVNVSGADMLDATFPDRVQAAIQKTKVSTDKIVFEITEDTVMLDPQRTLQTLEEIGKAGIRFALDDYGTGHSSLSYLKQLPVSKLKIDRSFVSDMTRDSRDAVIVASTIDLAHRLGMTVVAEGVELVEHREQLAAMGCDDMQGYLLTQPLSVPELQRWIGGQPYGLPRAS